MASSKGIPKPVRSVSPSLPISHGPQVLGASHQNVPSFSPDPPPHAAADARRGPDIVGKNRHPGVSTSEVFQQRGWNEVVPTIFLSSKLKYVKPPELIGGVCI